MFNIIITELMKLKRNKILWLIPIVDIVTIIISMIALNRTQDVHNAHTWGWLLNTVLVMMNYVSPAIIAVFTVYIFNREYQDNTLNFLFTYPINRLKFYLAKLVVVFLMAVALFIFSILFTIIAGLIYHFQLYSSYNLYFFIKCSLYAILINSMLIPLAAYIGILSRSVISGSILSITYVLSLLLLPDKDYNVYLPGCIPSLIASVLGRDIGGYLVFYGDLETAHISLFIIFVVSIAVGSVWYKNLDVK